MGSLEIDGLMAFLMIMLAALLSAFVSGMLLVCAGTVAIAKKERVSRNQLFGWFLAAGTIMIINIVIPFAVVLYIETVKGENFSPESLIALDGLAPVLWIPINLLAFLIIGLFIRAGIGKAILSESGQWLISLLTALTVLLIGNIAFFTGSLIVGLSGVYLLEPFTELTVNEYPAYLALNGVLMLGAIIGCKYILFGRKENI